MLTVRLASEESNVFTLFPLALHEVDLGWGFKNASVPSTPQVANADNFPVLGDSVKGRQSR